MEQNIASGRENKCLMKIKSSVRAYEAQFYPNLISTLNEAISAPNVFTLVDAQVRELYADDLAGLKGPVIAIDALENNKSFEKVGTYIVELLNSGFRKNCQLLVIGGGILQDIGGFIASVLFRGVEWTLIPTTLLAQCDSCIGSKTSMNISKYKNQLGTFYPPKKVLLPNNVLSTLKAEDVKSGICEAIKLAMIDSVEGTKTMFAALERGYSPQALQPVISQALQIKKTFIEEDEYDRGRRNLLNYGHTFGHAFETVSSYRIPHGIAVGLGMEAANFFSWKLNLLPEEEWLRVRGLLQPWCDSYRGQLKGFAVQELMKAMKTDKKSSTDQIGFILTEGFGKMKRQSVGFEDSQRLLIEYLNI